MASVENYNHYLYRTPQASSDVILALYSQSWADRTLSGKPLKSPTACEEPLVFFPVVVHVAATANLLSVNFAP